LEIIYIFISAVVIFLAVILIKALKFNPPIEKDISITNINTDKESLVTNFSKMIKCKTVSSYDRELIDWNEFSKFKNLLVALYPNIHRVCTKEEIGETGILYSWKGKSSENPTVLMSHYDVVPANEELWSKPAFEAVYENDVIWGRGTLDTKGTLCSILEAAEKLIAEGYVPSSDIYFSFSGDEEISGNSTPAIVKVLKERNIHPSLVLDEGGAIVENVFPGVHKSCALIGIGEKGYVDLELSITGKGGHSSAPPPHTLVGVLAKAIVNIEKHPFKAHMTPPAKEMFNSLGRYSSFGYKIIFANLWCFKPLLDIMVKQKGGELNALLRTTCAVNKVEGSKAFNVMPPKASAGLNIRLLATESIDAAVAYLKKAINNDAVSVKVIYGRNASPYAPTSSKEWEKVHAVIRNTWGDIIVSPYLMLAGSDSRHYCSICDNVLRFSAMRLSKEERGLIHGNDERIPVSSLLETVSFYTRLMEQC
jgi:carboxypeptidase PM20D1